MKSGLFPNTITLLSSFTIDFDGAHSGFTDYEVNVTVNKVAEYSGTNLALHFVLTESHIEQFWQGMSELNYVERLMVPNQNGTTLNFSSGNPQEIAISFSIASGWNPEHCEVVAFVQDLNTKEILQGAKMELSAFPTSNQYDVSLVDIYNIPVTMCENSFIPYLTVTNYGLKR